MILLHVGQSSTGAHVKALMQAARSKGHPKTTEKRELTVYKEPGLRSARETEQNPRFVKKLLNTTEVNNPT